MRLGALADSRCTPNENGRLRFPRKRPPTGHSQSSRYCNQAGQGHGHEGQQRPVIPRGGATQRGAYACAGEDETEAARVFYVAATRAMQRLVRGVTGNGLSRSRIAGYLETQQRESTP